MSAALGIGLIGCGTEPDDTVDITLTPIPDLNGNSCTVNANIVGSSGVSNIIPTCTKSDGTTVPVTDISFGNIPAPSSTGDLSFTMNISPNTCDGDYVLQLTATSGNKTELKTTPFVVTGKKVCSIPVLDIRSDSATLGSFGNSVVGSSIDLDRDSVMKAVDAVKENSGIDIVYNWIDSLTAVVYNPVFVKSIENTVFTDWVSPNDTKFHKVTADFDKITTAAQIQELFSESKAIEKKITVSVNDVLIVKTDKDKYVLVKIKSVFPTSSAIAMLKYSVKKE
jgi:arsenate reductase-like glutaredoxin family protein